MKRTEQPNYGKKNNAFSDRISKQELDQLKRQN